GSVHPILSATCSLFLSLLPSHLYSLFPFSFHHPATTEIHTLSLHDALPISSTASDLWPSGTPAPVKTSNRLAPAIAALSAPRTADRKSTRLNSSHQIISYAVFCLKKKKKKIKENTEKKDKDRQKLQSERIHA